jgi:hypothetical protein
MGVLAESGEMGGKCPFDGGSCQQRFLISKSRGSTAKTLNFPVVAVGRKRAWLLITAPVLSPFAAARRRITRATDQRYAKITADGERLIVQAYRHHRAVDIAVPRIEDVTVLIGEAVALHVPDQRQAEQRRILAVIPAAWGPPAAETVLRSRLHRARCARRTETSRPACRSPSRVARHSAVCDHC